MFSLWKGLLLVSQIEEQYQSGFLFINRHKEKKKKKVSFSSFSIWNILIYKDLLYLSVYNFCVWYKEWRVDFAIYPLATSYQLYSSVED